MNPLSIWLQASRPKTLIISAAPVAIGTAFAAPHFDALIFLFTLLGALFIQIGTNLANDYFDFVKGSDTPARKGPIRVMQAGLVAPAAMRKALFLTFGAAALCSSYLVLKGGLAIAVLSSLSILLGLAYTAGPLPLAYLGLGDIFVLLFFGPVATGGTYYLQTDSLSPGVIAAGFGCGLIAAAVLTVNNLRDVDEDRRANKKTLCVRFGTLFGKWEYTLALVLAALIPCSWGNYASLLLLVPSFFLIRKVWKEEDWNILLARTGMLLAPYALLASYS